MERCNCWKTKSVVTKWRNDTPIDVETVQYCNGTKEQEVCSCRGDVSKCDFYPEKRKGGKGMNTAEMWLKAQEDGKIYYCGPLEYQKDFGLRFSETKGIPDRGSWVSLNQFMKEQWYPCPIMTISEAEAKFNIKIVGD